MSIVTFIGGPFDGEIRIVPDNEPGRFEYGWVQQSDTDRIIGRRFAVYVPNGPGRLVFECWAASLDAGLAMLPKEHKP